MTNADETGEVPLGGSGEAGGRGERSPPPFSFSEWDAENWRRWTRRNRAEELEDELEYYASGGYEEVYGRYE